MTPDSLLLFRYLLSQNGEQSFHKHQRARQVCVLYILNFLRKARESKNKHGYGNDT
jgi:hypothetical protein